jgi:MarR family transcriptional regulator, lower aerobic nicotinate degradation pathway regulator
VGQACGDWMVCHTRCYHAPDDMPTSRNLGEAHSVLNSFRCLVKSLRLADRAGLKEHGLGASQLYVLHELKRDSPLSVNELAERTATDQSTVSVVVAKLIEKGFVARERDERDARRLSLTLTAKGHLIVKNLPPPIQHSIIEGVKRLPPARARALAESLRAICDVLGIADEHPPMLMSDESNHARKPQPVKSRKAPPRRSPSRR